MANERVVPLANELDEAQENASDQVTIGLKRLNPNIPYTFPKLLTRRMSLAIKSFSI